MRRLHAVGDAVISLLDASLILHPEWAKLGRFIKPGFDDCWEWTGSRTKQGYGRLNRSGRNQHANRFILALVKPPSDPELCACHHCDNPPCVRPSHLFWGTVAENNADMLVKGRLIPPKVRAGSAHHKAKITEDEAMEIRRLRRAGLSQAKIGEIFGLSQTSVGRIDRGELWRHVL
jgi:hypothetical protein